MVTDDPSNYQSQDSAERSALVVSSDNHQQENKIIVENVINLRMTKNLIKT